MDGERPVTVIERERSRRFHGAVGTHLKSIVIGVEQGQSLSATVPEKNYKIFRFRSVGTKKGALRTLEPSVRPEGSVIVLV